MFQYFFSLRPLPIDKAGCLLILYHIPDMLEELWVKNIIFRAIPSQTQQGGHVQDRVCVCVCERGDVLRMFMCSHTKRDKTKLQEDFHRPQVA